MKGPSKHHRLAADESRLVHLCKAGDRAAFDELVMRYKDMIYTLCYRILNDYDDANDASQDTFIKAFNKIGDFRGDAALGTWLYRIAINTCRDRASLRGRIRRFLADDDPETVSQRVPQREPGPAESYARRETCETVQAALAALPKELRILVVLHDMEGHSVEETALLAGVPAGTVKSRLSRARHVLRERLKGVL